jgi:uncharacterized coiled-coil protein SlyX
MAVEKKISEVMQAAFAQEVAEHEARLKALATKEAALVQTIAELEAQIGDNLMPKAHWRKEYDKLRAKAKAFADS